jgi:hypothetical protein
MANQGAKKRSEENKKKLTALQYALLISLGLFLFIRLIWQRSTTGIWHYAGFSLVAGSSWFCYSGLRYMAAPVYSSNGELIDGGADLSMGGVCGYYHDWIYISCFVMFTASFSNWFWWTFILVPVYGGYMLWVKVLHPYFMAPREEETMDEATRKKLEKQQRRADKRQQKSMSRR